MAVNIEGNEPGVRKTSKCYGRMISIKVENTVDL